MEMNWNYFDLSQGKWIYLVLFVLFVAWFIYSCIKDEKDYKKGIKLKPEPDESSSRVRHWQSGEILESEDETQDLYIGVDLASVKDKTVEFHITKDPGLIPDDTIIHMN